MAGPLTKANLNDPVTLHMRQDFTRLPLGQTVGEALDWLRQHPPQGRIVYFYVIDGDGRIQGVMPTRRLLLNPPDRHLADIMVKKVVTLPPEATVLDACEFFIQHRLLAFPVVDTRGVLLGVVDVELYTDEVVQLGNAAARDDLFQMIGVHVTHAQQDSPLVAFRHRFPWLGCNMAAGILAALLSGLYQDVLEKVVVLAFFIPVVLNLAESVSSQSVSLALQGFQGQRPTWKSMFRKLRKELATGLLLGLGGGLVIALTAWFWQLQLPERGAVALALVGGITGGVAGAAVLGLALPTLLRLLRLEPRVAAGPIALAGADVLTILLYFSLARWLLA